MVRPCFKYMCIHDHMCMRAHYVEPVHIKATHTPSMHWLLPSQVHACNHCMHVYMHLITTHLHAWFLHTRSACTCLLLPTHLHTSITTRIGQNRIYTYIYTVYLVISKPRIPYVHRIYMVQANPNYYTRVHACMHACTLQ